MNIQLYNILRLYKRCNSPHLQLYMQSSTSSDISTTEKIAKALQLPNEENNNNKIKTTDKTSFASMLRSSTLMQLGDPCGRHIVGIVKHSEPDLYIDFGGKFYCVCKKSSSSKQQFKRDDKVRIRLNDLELASKFMGSEKSITLLEADGVLIGRNK